MLRTHGALLLALARSCVSSVLGLFLPSPLSPSPRVGFLLSVSVLAVKHPRIMRIGPSTGNGWKALVLLLLAGCASERPQNSGAKAFPTPPTQEQVLIFFYTQRHDALKAYPTLHIDGTEVVKLPKNSYTWCYVKPGPRVVHALWDDRYASLNVHINHDFKGGECAFLRLITTTGGQGVLRFIEPVRPEVAHVQIGNAVYRPPKKQTID